MSGWGGEKWRVRCVMCGWKGIRTSTQCECYEDWAMYCRPSSPGPGCPAGVIWPCPKCGPMAPGAVGPLGGSFSNGSSVRGIAPVKARVR